MMKVEGLLKAGASVDCPDEPAHSTNSPLNWEREGHQAVAELLLLHKDDVNSVGQFERTPLCWAARKCHSSPLGFARMGSARGRPQYRRELRVHSSPLGSRPKPSGSSGAAPATQGRRQQRQRAWGWLYPIELGHALQQHRGGRGAAGGRLRVEGVGCRARGPMESQAQVTSAAVDTAKKVLDTMGRLDHTGLGS